MKRSRYTIQKLEDGAIVLRYSMGYCSIECNSKTGKTIVTNETGSKWIPYQFDEIFGLGEYKKFQQHIVQEIKIPSPGNPHSIRTTIVGNYLPKQAKKDIKAESPSEKNDLIGKYFK